MTFAVATVADTGFKESRREIMNFAFGKCSTLGQDRRPAGDREGRPAIRTLERVNQVELVPVEIGLLLTCRGDGLGRKSRVVLEAGVERAPMPPGEAGQRVGAQSPEGVNAILQNVRRRALVAFRK